MDLGNLLASAAYGGVQGWVAGQRRENQELAIQEEETRKQELLMRREEAMNKYKPIGVRKDGSVVFADEYQPGIDKVYKEAPKAEENEYLTDMRQMEEAFGPEGAAAYKNKALGVGKPEKTELGTLYRTPDGTTYTEGQLAQMQQQGQLPEGLYKVGNAPKGDDDIARRQLYNEAYADALGKNSYPSAEDRRAAALHAEGVSGLKLDMPMQDGGESLYPEAKTGMAGFGGNREETAQVVAIDRMDGIGEQDIRKKLVKAGWAQEDMDKILKLVEENYGNIIKKKDSTPAAQTPQEKKGQKSAAEPSKQKGSAPQGAIDLLMSDPAKYKDLFKQKYGYLPEGV